MNMIIDSGTKLWLSEPGAKGFLYASESSYISYSEKLIVTEVAFLKAGDKKVPVKIDGNESVFWIDELIFQKIKMENCKKELCKEY